MALKPNMTPEVEIRVPFIRTESHRGVRSEHRYEWPPRFWGFAALRNSDLLNPGNRRAIAQENLATARKPTKAFDVKRHGHACERDAGPGHDTTSQRMRARAQRDATIQRYEPA